MPTPLPPEPAPFVSWADFLAAHFVWHQGEHVSIVGPTGTGKSTLALELLDRRRFVIVYGTKPRDPLLTKLHRPLRRGGLGYKLARDWPAGPSSLFPRVLLWPKQLGIDDEAGAQLVFARSMRDAYRAGGWCLYLDEMADFAEELNLGGYLRTLWRKGRSLGLSVVGATQRPRGVPLLAWSSASHVFLFATRDDEDLRRVGGIGGMDSATIRAAVKNLGRHDVLYVNARDKIMLRTRVDV